MIKRVVIQDDQTLFDIAIQEYGIADAATIKKLLDENPLLAFDYTAKQTDDVAEERIIIDNYEVIEAGFTDIAYPLVKGQTINIDTLYAGKDSAALKQLAGAVIATGYAEPLNN